MGKKRGNQSGRNGRRAPIDYLYLDSSSDLHEAAIQPMEEGARVAMEMIRGWMNDPDVARAAVDAAVVLLESPLGEALEFIALPPKQPAGLERSITLDYSKLLDDVQTWLASWTPRPGAVEADDVDHLKKSLSRQIAKALKYSADDVVHNPATDLKRSLLG